jgi:pyruvate,water dikinase
MSWFQNLDQIAWADPAAVGYTAYYLGQLKQRHLPVASGWVLTTEAWREMLGQVVWPQPTDSLTALAMDNGEQLGQISRAWQGALTAVWGSLPFAADLLDCPLTGWMVRSSLWLDPDGGMTCSHLANLQGLLPEVVGDGAGPPLLEALQRFWLQALTARSLMVWRQYCQSLTQVGLGTLVMPLYPAQFTGRLSLAAGAAQVEVVAGLGLPLIQGEAIPARCQVDLGYPDQAHWQVGHQERVYGLQARTDLQPAGADPTSGVRGPSVEVTDRPQAALKAPLNTAQLEGLLQLAEQVQAAIPGDGVQMEWMLCPVTGSADMAWVITQAMPWMAPTPPLVRPSRASEPLPENDRGRRDRQLAPPPLPHISVVVKGIGVSSGRVQAAAVVAQRPQDLPDPLPEGCIVVLPDLQPDRFLQLAGVAGLVIEQGGATCHAAILAREMGIPAVVGAPQATQLIDPDLVLWLDGERGLVYGVPQAVIARLGHQDKSQRQILRSVTADVWPDFTWSDAERFRALHTKVMVNLSQSSRAKNLPISHIGGIGLLRAEWLMLEILDRRHPWHWVEQGQGAELQARLVQTLAPILQALGDKPVRYRSLDLRSHEWQTLEGSPPADANPMLGLRGTLSYGIDSRLFEVELGALADLQQAGYHNVQLMLPFVRSVEEVMTCCQYIDAVGLRQQDGFALWIMAEVPSVLFLLPAYARAGVEGIAIGSNDLTQLLLAIDRDQRTIASAYDERHPVVRMALAHLIQGARQSGMTCSICGQAPVRHPELIADLVAWGIDSISVETGALPFTLEAVWQAEQGRG